MHYRVLVLLMFSVLPLCAQNAPKPPPTFEEYVGKKGGANAYFRAALGYLKTESHPRYKARVVLDMLMVADFGKMDEMSGDMREILLMQLGNTIQAAHVMETYASASEYEKFLDSRLSKLLHKQNRRVSAYYCNGVQWGLRHFGESFMNGNRLPVLTYLMAEAAGNKKLRELAEPRLKQIREKDEAVDKLLKVCDDSRRSAAYRVEKLDQFSDKLAGTLKRFYLMYVSAAEKKKTAIGRIAARSALLDRNDKAALKILDDLPDAQTNGELLVLRALCLRGLKLTTEAEAVLGKVKDGPWAETAAKLLSGGKAYKRHRDALAKALQTAASHLKKSFSNTLLKGTYKDKESGKQYTFFIDFAHKEGHMRALVQRGDDIVFAMNCSTKGTSVYYKGSPKILSVPSFSVLPMPKMTITRDPTNGQFVFGANMRIAESMDAAVNQGAQMFDSPYISTTGGVLTLLDYMYEKGVVIDPPQTAEDGSLSFVGYNPFIDKPGLTKFSAVFGKGGHLRKITTEVVTVELTQNAADFKMPELPKLPKDVVTDQSAFLRVMQFLVTAAGDLMK